MDLVGKSGVDDFLPFAIFGPKGVDKISCDQCGHEHFDEQMVTADSQWIYAFIEIHARGSPQNTAYDPFHKIRTQERKLLFMPIDDKNH